MGLEEDRLESVASRDKRVQLAHEYRIARLIGTVVVLCLAVMASCSVLKQDTNRLKDQLDQQREAFCIEKGGTWENDPDSFSGHKYCNMPDN